MSQQVEFASAQEAGKVKSIAGNYDFFPDLVFTYDLERDVVEEINSKIYSILGITQKEFQQLNASLSSLILKEDALILINSIEQFHTLSAGESHTFTARFIHKEGGFRCLKVVGTLVPASGERPDSVLCVATDVTAKVKAEDESRATRQLFDETERLLLFGTWSWSMNTDKLTWTDGMYELLGYTPAEVTEVTNEFYLRHVLHEHVEAVRTCVLDAIAHNRGFEIEYVIRTRDGQEKFVFTKGRALLDENGNLTKVIGITRDVTANKMIEKERDRTIRDLNRSNKELEEFAYVASHDLHEPLRKVLTFSERLKSKFSDSLGEDGKLYLERIGASAQGMRALIDNLLEFSKISRLYRSFEPCDMNIILEQVLSDQELRIEETSTTIELRDMPVIEAVPAEMRQLFNNLISNALKFRQKDVPPKISITCKKLTHREKSDLLLPFNQIFYQINVRDNGIGFESVYSEKIFEIFQRLHGKTEYGGSGIGLAICKKIVESHYGLISASGETGNGAVFSVILPEKQQK